MIASLFLSVAIVAHEPGYYTSLANHVGRWLKDQDIAAEVVKPADMRTKLANEKIAFLVGFSATGAASSSSSIPHRRSSASCWASARRATRRLRIPASGAA